MHEAVGVPHAVEERLQMEDRTPVSKGDTLERAGPVEVREMGTDTPPALVHEGWAEAFPWLVQGTTTRGRDTTPYDLGLFSGGSPVDEVQRRWADLRAATGMTAVVHARQVHGRRVRVHTGDVGGLELVGESDGHVTMVPGVLLAVTTADCVPVFLVDPRRRLVGMVHAGWRGAAAGIAEAAIERARSLGTAPDDLHVHLGPAICGACYEVGPEVHAALGHPAPAGPTPVDLRVVLAEHAIRAGVGRGRVTVSAHCTRCTESGLFSHRGGDPHRQVGYIGIRG